MSICNTNISNNYQVNSNNFDYFMIKDENLLLDNNEEIHNIENEVNHWLNLPCNSTDYSNIDSSFNEESVSLSNISSQENFEEMNKLSSSTLDLSILPTITSPVPIEQTSPPSSPNSSNSSLPSSPLSSPPTTPPSSIYTSINIENRIVPFNNTRYDSNQCCYPLPLEYYALSPIYPSSQMTILSQCACSPNCSYYFPQICPYISYSPYDNSIQQHHFMSIPSSFQYHPYNCPSCITSYQMNNKTALVPSSINSHLKHTRNNENQNQHINKKRKINSKLTSSIIPVISSNTKINSNISTNENHDNLRKSRPIRPKVMESKGAIQCKGKNRKKGIQCRNAALMEYIGPKPEYCAEHIDLDPKSLYTKCKSSYQKEIGDNKGCKEVVLKEFGYCYKHYGDVVNEIIKNNDFQKAKLHHARILELLYQLEKDATAAKKKDNDLYQRKNKLIPKFQEMKKLSLKAMEVLENKEHFISTVVASS
jgi:hypothetical protein